MLQLTRLRTNVEECISVLPSAQLLCSITAEAADICAHQRYAEHIHTTQPMVQNVRVLLSVIITELINVIYEITKFQSQHNVNKKPKNSGNGQIKGVPVGLHDIIRYHPGEISRGLARE